MLPLPCPKCNGKLFEEADRTGAFYTCLNCGYQQDKPQPLKPIAEIDWTQIKNQWTVKR